jgi:hypothetical protein
MVEKFQKFLEFQSNLAHIHVVQETKLQMVSMQKPGTTGIQAYV